MTHAIILGVIQGLTEFLPISSSGHLLIIPHLFHWPASGLTFDVALNTGTFVAVLIYFWRQWWALLWDGLVNGDKTQRQLLVNLIIATIPAALLGLLGEKIVTNYFRQPLLAAFMLVVFGVILYTVDKSARLKRSVGTITWKDALVIGLAQSLALVPGVSRSGITITTGLWRGLKREAATEFSFLLLAPISLGAAITQIPQVIHASNHGELLVGTVVSFVVGLLAIRLVFHYLKTYGFKPYIWYRIAAGLVFGVLILLSY